jgi:hypothetical protein
MEKWKGTLDRMIHLKCDIVGLTETCVNLENKKLRERYNNILKRINRNSFLEVSSIRTEIKKHYIPGGTASIVLGGWQNRNINAINDNSGLGRWSGVIIRVDEEKTLHYINAYKVCNQSLSRTNNTSTFGQQYLMLK